MYWYLMLTKRKIVNARFSDFRKISSSGHLSNTLFIFGSGYSINNITSQQWVKIKYSGQIMSFNEFWHGDFIDVDFHVMREIGYSSFLHKDCYKNIRKYLESIYCNARFSNAKYLVLFDKKSPGTSFAFLKNLLKEPFAFYSNITNRMACKPISSSNRDIPHCQTTLFDCINLGYSMGFKKIILFGVDLSDRRYFWLAKDQAREIDIKRGSTSKDVHNTAKPVLTNIVFWRNFLQSNGVSLFNGNPNSMLAEELPLFKI